MTVIERSGIVDAKSRDNEEDDAGKQSSADEQGHHHQHDQQEELENKNATRPQQQLGAPSAAAQVAASPREEEPEESPRRRYWILDERIRRGRGRLLLPQGNEQEFRLDNQALFSPLSPRLEDFARRDEEGDTSNEDRGQHVRFGEFSVSSPSNITFQARERAPLAAGAAVTARGDGAGVADPAPHNQQLALPILQDRQNYAMAPTTTSRSSGAIGVARDAPEEADDVAVSLSVLAPPQTSASSNGSGGYEGGSEEEDILAEDDDPDDDEQHDVAGWVETLFDLLEEQQVDGANKVVLGSTTTGGIDGGPEELEEAGDAMLEAPPAVAVDSDRKAAVGPGRREQEEGKTSGAGSPVSPEKGRSEKHSGFQAVASTEEVEALVRSTTPLTSNKKKLSVKPQRPPRNGSAALPRVQRRRTRIIEEDDEDPRSPPVVPDAAGGGYSLSSLVAVSSAQLALAQVAGGGEESMMAGAQLQDQQQEEASLVVQQNDGLYYYYPPNRNEDHEHHGPTSSHTNQPSRLQEVHFAFGHPTTGLTTADMEPSLHMPPAANYDNLGSSPSKNVPSSSDFRGAEPPLEANVPSWVQEHNRQQNERRLQQQIDAMEAKALSSLHQSLEMTPVPCLLTLTSFPFRVAHANEAYGTALGQSSVLAIGASFFDIIEELEPPLSSQPTKMAPPTRKPPPTFSNCSSLVGRYREDEVVRVFGANSSSSGGATSRSKNRSRKAASTSSSQQEQQSNEGEESSKISAAAADSERQGERLSILCNIKVEAVMRTGSLPAAKATSSSSSLVCQEYPESRSSLFSMVGPTSSLRYFVVRLTPVPSSSSVLSASTLSPSDLLSLLQSQYQESLKQGAGSSRSSPARGRSRRQSF